VLPWVESVPAVQLGDVSLVFGGCPNATLAEVAFCQLPVKSFRYHASLRLVGQATADPAGVVPYEPA
jgi:hypothetical protein